MDVQKLFEMQKGLDSYIESKHGLQNEPLLKKKVLAFLVELGELANETRCFKFWSVKPPSERKIILEEYVDGLHFLLSIGIEMDVTTLPVLNVEALEEDVTSQFLQLFQDISRMNEQMTQDEYTQLFTRYVGLGLSLQFTMEEIYDAYMSKNEVNHQRQNEGY